MNAVPGANIVDDDLDLRLGVIDVGWQHNLSLLRSRLADRELDEVAN
jgi:hypothetical protein